MRFLTLIATALALKLAEPDDAAAMNTFDEDLVELDEDFRPEKFFARVHKALKAKARGRYE